MILHSPMQAEGWDGYHKVVEALKCRATALDIGSNTGGIAAILAKDFGHVYAYEPLLDYLPPAQVGYPPNSTVHRIALGAMADRDYFTVQNCWTLVRKSLGAKTDVALEFLGKVVLVDILPADMLHKERVDFVKLDVDGAEAQVLDGAAELLKEWRPPVMMELSSLAKLVGEEPMRAAEILFGLGYRAMSMDGKFFADSMAELAPYWPHHTSYDVIFVPKEMKI